MAGPGNISYRPVRAIGLLLALQVACLAGLAVHEVLQVDWRQLDPQRVVIDASSSRQVIEAVALALFVPPAVMTLM